ncbi:MAG: protein phosphatase 2C domain-containing protein [Lachnospiraceae bacterium]|nr:protein phosphatase 2C domain-containing protein [Lachnospiraceae bacterium]
MDYKLISNPGSREINEDSAAVFKKGNSALFVLADGLGGHGRGEVASAMFTETAGELFEAEPEAEDLIERIFEEGQRRILARQEEEHARNELKTTGVVLLVRNGSCQWGHVGDSRLYHFRSGKLQRRTLDHSVPQMLVSAGELRESKIRSHPDRNRLLRVLGTEWETPAYVIAEPAAAEGGEAFLLCSDGFWELILEKEMQKLLQRSGTAEEWLEAMNGIVQKRGIKKDMDNNTAIALRL